MVSTPNRAFRPVVGPKFVTKTEAAAANSKDARLQQLREAARKAREAQIESRKGPEWTTNLGELEGVPLYLLALYGPRIVRSKHGPQETLTAEMVDLDGSPHVTPIRGPAVIEALTEPGLVELVAAGGQPAVMFLKVDGASGFPYWTVTIDFDGNANALVQALTPEE